MKEKKFIKKMEQLGWKVVSNDYMVLAFENKYSDTDDMYLEKPTLLCISKPYLSIYTNKGTWDNTETPFEASGLDKKTLLLIAKYIRFKKEVKDEE